MLTQILNANNRFINKYTSGLKDNNVTLVITSKVVYHVVM